MKPSTVTTAVSPGRFDFDRDSVVTEATRLHSQHPDSTFLVLQEVGRVKVTESIGSDVVGLPARHSARPGGKAY